MEEKTNKRKRCDNAKKLRCTTLICVLEEPSNPANMGAIVRNIDVLGVSKLYVIGKRFCGSKDKRTIHNTSCGSSNYVYIHYFDTTKECIEYLEKNNFTSLVTSPYQKSKDNFPIIGTDFTKYKKLAIWFGNESRGISDEAVELSSGCINIEMAGIGESLNLSNASSIVLHQITNQRRQYKMEKMKKLST
jgi:tRNA (guanosine-2'-O-)-methyltransferase